jgi:hypothetical protein
MTGSIEAGKEFAMLDGLTPDLAPRLVLAIGGVGIALVILVLVLIFLKRRNSPLFIKGGKSREPRLLVLDAAAVDPKRRLVLIRRDEVEHLIMIGGPTDIVIETGITDRLKPAVAARAVPLEEIAARRAAAAATPETRQAASAPDIRPEAVRPAPAAQAERPLATALEARTAEPAAHQPVRSAASQPGITEKIAPAAERLVEQPRTEPEPDTRGVSAMGEVLYGEDREPMTGSRPLSAAPAPQVQRSQPVRSEQSVAQALEQRNEPAATAAADALDAARNRVLANPSVTSSSHAASDEAERLLAARLEAIRPDPMRRVQSAQPAAQTAAHQAPQPVAQRQETDAEALRNPDQEPSDFEKLLEAELDASGIFGSQTPNVRGDTRVTNAIAAANAAPPVKVTPPITGATPDVTSEEEVARRLGEIAINRKP